MLGNAPQQNSRSSLRSAAGPTARGKTSGVAWNDLQNTPRHISALSNYLVRTYLAERTGRK